MTTAARAGLLNLLIKDLGRWKSLSFTLYIWILWQELSAVLVVLASSHQMTPTVQCPRQQLYDIVVVAPVCFVPLIICSHSPCCPYSCTVLTCFIIHVHVFPLFCTLYCLIMCCSFVFLGGVSHDHNIPSTWKGRLGVGVLA